LTYNTKKILASDEDWNHMVQKKQNRFVYTQQVYRPYLQFSEIS